MSHGPYGDGSASIGQTCSAFRLAPMAERVGRHQPFGQSRGSEGKDNHHPTPILAQTT
jgi:hypothetical protein